MTTTGIFYEIFEGLPRQGPGDNASTQQALAMLADLPARPTILDIGCGAGMQTLELAIEWSGDQARRPPKYPIFSGKP